MKTGIKNIFLLPALMAGLGWLSAGRVTAQTFTTLHSFSGSNDGVGPAAGLILSGNTLYGTTSGGGDSGRGTVFAASTDGTGFRTLYSFSAISGSVSGGYPSNSDGIDPQAPLVLSGNTLYGTTVQAGNSGYGTVFAVDTDGTGFQTLHSFAHGDDGAWPYAGLILAGNTLYGAALGGGSANRGTVFAVNTDGTGFTTLHSQNGFDGDGPFAKLVLSGNTLYGTASSPNGTIFTLNTDGTGFRTLYSFSGSNDGANPHGGAVLSGNTLYGTAYGGGTFGSGTVFAVGTNGTGFTTLHSFTTPSGSPPSTNSDGANPFCGLILSGSTLYGTAYRGGNSGYGTVFAVNADGTGFKTLHSFTTPSGSSPSTNTDGAGPIAGLILAGNILFGTASRGGNFGNGTVFSLSLPPPQLTITRSVENVVLTWPSNAAEFTLQSTTKLASPALWSAVSPGPVLANGQNTVTNPVSGTQNFFRLSQ